MRCGCGREPTEDEHVENAPESLPRRRDGERGWFLLTADGVPFEEHDFGKGDMRSLMVTEFSVGKAAHVMATALSGGFTVGADGGITVDQLAFQLTSDGLAIHPLITRPEVPLGPLTSGAELLVLVDDSLVAPARPDPQ